MKTPSANSVLRWMPSLSDVVVLMPLVLVAGRMPQGVSTLVEGDTGWHVRTGEWILQNHSVPRTDLFSYTNSLEPWFAWEWLWDAMFAWVHQTGGMNAVVMVNLAILSLTFLLLYRLVRSLCGNAFLAVGMTLLAELLSSVHWLARPHLMTLLLLVISLHIMRRAKAGAWSWLIVLTGVTILWTNLHGGFVALFVVLGCYAAGELLAATLVEDRTEHLWRAAMYAGVLLCCLMASMVNPYGYLLHVHVVQYLADGYYTKNVQEFLAMSFQHPLGGFFEVYLLLAIPAVFWSVKQRRMPEAVLLLFWIHQALLSARHVPVLAIVGTPIVAVALEEWVVWIGGAARGWPQRVAAMFQQEGLQFGAVDKRATVPVSGMAGLVLFAWMMNLPNAPGRLTARFTDGLYPVKAIEQLEPVLPQRIYTSDEWGDYLIYRLYPRIKVFVDGRSDFYGPVFCQTYMDIWNVKYDWNETLARFEVDMALLPAASALAGAMKESRGWRIVYDDGVAIAYQKQANPAGGTLSLRQRNTVGGLVGGMNFEKEK